MLLRGASIAAHSSRMVIGSLPRAASCSRISMVRAADLTSRTPPEGGPGGACSTIPVAPSLRHPLVSASHLPTARKLAAGPSVLAYGRGASAPRADPHLHRLDGAAGLEDHPLGGGSQEELAHR